MPDTNDTDAILAKVRSGELSAGDAAALIANLHAASYKAMQDAQTAQAQPPEPPAPQAASQPGMSQQAPVAAAAPCYQPQVPAMPAYAAPTPDAVAEKAQETVPQHPQAPTAQHPSPYEPPAYVPAASAPEPHPVYDQPSPAVNPYRQPAPDTTATLPAQDATASQPEPETAYHQASPLPYNPPQETDKYIPEPAEEQEPKKKREKPAKPSKPSRAERKAEKRKTKEEAKAAKAQKRAADRRGAASPNAPSLTGMEKIAVKVSRLQKVTAGLAVIAVLAGGVAVVSEIDANNRIAEAFSGTTEVVAATKTIRAGDEIAASDLAFVSVPNSTVADGAITKKDIDDSSKTPVGRVATQYIAKGSQLTNASTAGKDNPESLAAAIGDGMEAVTISVDAQSGMGGMLRVNDRVKVIQPNDGSLGGDEFTLIADSVRIAALDGNFSSGSGSSDGYSTVTLEVTPEQAGKIRTAGGLTLTLPSSADTTESGE